MTAQKYAKRNWAVIPCYASQYGGHCGCNNLNCSSVGKHPRTNNGFKDASTDIQQIQHWWTQWPESNIGIITGQQSGLVVLDVDGDVGHESLCNLIQLHGPLPNTLTAITGRGQHFYFSYPEGHSIKNSAGKIGKNLDIRADGGFVIAPPSRHASGHEYQWEDESLSPALLPSWLLKLITSPNLNNIKTHQATTVAPNNQFLQNACEQIRHATEGSRNDTLNRQSFMVGQRIASGLISHAEAERDLLDAAVACGLSMAEAKRTVNNGIKAGMLEPYLMKNQNFPKSIGELKEWLPPEPLPTKLPNVETFSYNLLPNAFAPWIEDISTRLQSPPDFAAVGAMVALSSLVGRRIGICPKAQDDWLVIPNLWGLIIGRPGLMKTPALIEPLKPLNRLEAKTAEEFQEQYTTWEADKIITEEKTKLIRKTVSQSLKNNQEPNNELISFLKESADAEPSRKRYVVNDTSVEKLGEVLAVNSNGVLLFRDEILGFLRPLDKPGNEGSRAFYLESWNGNGRFTYDRIGRGTVEIEAACLSILGGVQPGPLRNYMRDKIWGEAGDDGLMQRFQLTVWPDISPTWENIDRLPDREARENAYRVFETISHYKPKNATSVSAYDEIPFLRFTHEAQELFTEWRTELEHRLRNNDEPPCLEAHLAKYRSLIPSLALLLHVADNKTGSVGITELEKALAWGEYLESHARRVYSLGTKADIESAQRLLKQLQKGALEDPFTLRDVYRHGWSGLTTPQEAESALVTLEEYHYIQRTSSTTGGRPTELFWINPVLREIQNG